MKSKQLFLNLFANFLSVFVSLFVSFFVTPYIINNIGKEAYSFVPISSNFIAYMSILTVALTSMTARFVTLSLHQGDGEKANDYYSTSFFTNLIMAAIVGVIGALIVVFLDRLINIPAPIVWDVKLLFAFSFLMFFTNIASNAFSVPAFSANRIDVTGMIMIASIVVRLAVIVAAFTFLPAHVYYIGVALFLATFTQGFLNFFAARKILPQLKISFKRFNLNLSKKLFSSGIWNSFNQLSNVLLTGLDLLVANLMLGASAAGLLSVAKTAPIALQALIGVVPQAFNPYMTIQYAKKTKAEFLAELRFILRFCAVITGIPIAGFLALSTNFYQLWVPSVASPELSMLSILTMLMTIASFTVLPLVYLFTITNRLKVPSTVIFISGTVNMLLVIVLVKYTDLGLFAIAGVSSILEGIRYLVFVPMYSAHVLNEAKGLFYKQIFRSLAYFFILLAVYSLIAYAMPATSWILLALNALLMGVIGIFIGFYVVFNQQERRKFTLAVLSKLRRKS